MFIICLCIGNPCVGGIFYLDYAMFLTPSCNLIYQAHCIVNLVEITSNISMSVNLSNIICNLINA